MYIRFKFINLYFKAYKCKLFLKRLFELITIDYKKKCVSPSDIQLEFTKNECRDIEKLFIFYYSNQIAVIWFISITHIKSLKHSKDHSMSIVKSVTVFHTILIPIFFTPRTLYPFLRSKLQLIQMY